MPEVALRVSCPRRDEPVRYDLLLGGPHKLFYGNDCTSEMRAALDRETLAELHSREHQAKKCLIDYVVEKIAGGEMSYPERHA